MTVSKANIQITATDKTHKAFNSVKKNAAAASKTVTGMALAAAAAVGAYSVGKTIEYGAALSDLSAITGATGDNLRYLDAAAKAYGSTTTLSASQSVQAMKLIASAKPDLLDNAAALATVTGEVIKLSEASGVDLASAADTVGESLNQFGAASDQAGRYVNVLAAGAKFGSSAVADTAVALKNAGTVAHGAGLSFEETNAAIQAMAKVGIKGGEAGTGLRNVLLKLSTQTRDEFNPEVVGFTKALSNLSQAHLSTAEKSKLFGLESIGAANALMQESGNLEALTAKLTGTNVAYDQAHTRMDNLAGDLKAMESAGEGAALAFGNAFNDMWRGIVQAETKGLQGLTAFINVMADADEQSALAIQIVDLQERLTDLKKNGLVGSGELFSYSSEEAGIADLQQRIDALISRRNDLLKQPKVEPSSDVVQAVSPTQSTNETSLIEEKKAAGVATAALDTEQKAAELARHQEQFAALAAMGIAANDDEETRRINAFQAKIDALDAEKEWLLEHDAWDLERQAANDDAKRELAQQLENDIYAIRAKGMSANEKLAKASASVQLKTSLDLLTSLTASASTESRGMFEINKAASLATATIKGIEAVQSSYATGAAIGGPVLGGAFATVAAVATGANLKKIQSTSYGGGGQTGSGGGGGIPSLATSTGTPVTTTPDSASASSVQPTAPQQPTTIVYIQGNVMNQQYQDEVLAPWMRDQGITVIQDEVTNNDVQLLAPDSANAHTLGVGVSG